MPRGPLEPPPPSPARWATVPTAGASVPPRMSSPTPTTPGGPPSPSRAWLVTVPSAVPSLSLTTTTTAGCPPCRTRHVDVPSAVKDMTSVLSSWTTMTRATTARSLTMARPGEMGSATVSTASTTVLSTATTVPITTTFTETVHVELKKRFTTTLSTLKKDVSKGPGASGFMSTLEGPSRPYCERASSISEAQASSPDLQSSALYC